MREYDPNVLGERIRHARTFAKLSQPALGKKVNRHWCLISRYERAEVKPGADVIFGLAQALDTTADWLLGLTDD